MAKYRKTALVEAEQFLPPHQIPEGCYQAGGVADVSAGHGEWMLNTLEGPHPLRHADFICTGHAGERWNVERSIFEATYEPATPKPPAGGDAVMTAALNQNDAMRQELAHVGNLVSDLARAMKVEQSNDDGTWPDLAGRVQRLTAAALALPAPVVEGEIVPPENGEPDPEWRAIKRAIDQFVGRVPTISKHRALNNAHIKGVVDRLDASGDHEAADTIVWQCWWRALDRERERFLLADKDEQIAALSEGRSHG